MLPGVLCLQCVRIILQLDNSAIQAGLFSSKGDQMVHVGGPHLADGVAGLFATEQGKDIPHDAGVAAAVTGLDAGTVAVLINSCPLLGIEGEQLDIAVHITYQLALGAEDADEAEENRLNAVAPAIRALAEKVELTVEMGIGGAVTVHAVVDGLMQKFVFTPI